MMSNLQHRSFLLITKTRKAREVLISKGGEEGEEGEEGEGEGKGKLIIRCMFCLQVGRPVNKGLATKR